MPVRQRSRVGQSSGWMAGLGLGNLLMAHAPTALHSQQKWKGELSRCFGSHAAGEAFLLFLLGWRAKQGVHVSIQMQAASCKHPGCKQAGVATLESSSLPSRQPEAHLSCRPLSQPQPRPLAAPVKVGATADKVEAASWPPEESQQAARSGDWAMASPNVGIPAMPSRACCPAAALPAA